MRLGSIDGAAVLVGDDRAVPIVDLRPDFGGTVLDAIDRWETLAIAPSEAEGAAGRTLARFEAPFLRPSKIIGIGLNYRQHAADLNAPLPTEPATFIKGHHVIIGDGDKIVLPPQSQRVTSEAELGLVVGRTAHRISEEDAPDFVFGVCPVLDQTAEDILQRNPRFLTTSKNFPTFLSFGPTITVLDEWLAIVGTLDEVTVTTERNGEVHRSNIVGDMTFSPWFIVSYLSHVMPLFPGDIICTGTPGAAVIEDGDQVTCRVDGLPPLTNSVVRPGFD